jgi:hypothetical protein
MLTPNRDLKAPRIVRQRPPEGRIGGYWTVSVPFIPASLWPGTLQKNS